MYDLFLQIVFMGSLGVIIYIMALSIPRIDHEEKPESKIRQAISSIPLAKIDDFIKGSKERALRRIRLFTMKLDNLISHSLHKSKEEDKDKQDKQDKPGL